MKKELILIFIGICFIICSLLLLGFNIYSGYKAEKEGRNIAPLIKEQITKNTSDDFEKSKEPYYIYNPYISMSTLEIEGKRYVGLLYIENINIEFPVLEEWNNKNRLPSKYCGSVYLDNMVICAHNYNNLFGKLGNLKMGDLIVFEDIDGNVFKYSVEEILVLKDTDIEEMKNGDCDLTLFTCDFSNTKRVTIRCEKIK